MREQLERLVEEMVAKGIRYGEAQEVLEKRLVAQVVVKVMVSNGIRYDEAHEKFEKRFIAQVLLKADGNLGRAADLLGIHRNTLSRKVAEYRLRANHARAAR